MLWRIRLVVRATLPHLVVRSVSASAAYRQTWSCDCRASRTWRAQIGRAERLLVGRCYGQKVTMLGEGNEGHLSIGEEALSGARRW